MITGNKETISEVTISPSSKDEHGFVINKTQEFLTSKGFGWLMEVDSSSESKENILGGESAEQPSILEELDIDVADIIFKVKKVVVPFGKFSSDDLEKLREPDFWGPFFIILAYALLVELTKFLQLKLITWMYLIWFIGSALLFALGRLFTPTNIEEAKALKKLRKGDNFQPINTSDNAQFPSMSNDEEITPEEEKIIDVHYGQVMSFVGYSLIPTVAILTVLLFFNLIFSKAVFVYLSFLLNMFSIGWSTVSCLYLFTAENYYLEKKKKLLVVPIMLLYLYFFSMQSGV